jgi:cell division inhibitor SulA
MPEEEAGPKRRTGRTVGAGQTWIEVRVAMEDRERLNEWAASMGVSASLIMRRLLEEALAEGRAERLELPGPQPVRARQRIGRERRP